MESLPRLLRRFVARLTKTLTPLELEWNPLASSMYLHEGQNEPITFM